MRISASCRTTLNVSARFFPAGAPPGCGFVKVQTLKRVSGCALLCYRRMLWVQHVLRCIDFPPPLQWKGHLCRPTPSLSAALLDFPAAASFWETSWKKKKSCRTKKNKKTKRASCAEITRQSSELVNLALIESALISSQTSCSCFSEAHIWGRFTYQE